LKVKSGTVFLGIDSFSALGSNLLLKGGKLSITIQKPLLHIKKAVPEVKKIHARFEPLKIRLNKRRLWDLYEKSSMLLPWVDDVRTCLKEAFV